MRVPSEQPHVDSIEDQSVEDAICPIRDDDVSMWIQYADGEERGPKNKLLKLGLALSEKSDEHECDQPVSTDTATKANYSSMLKIVV